MATIHNEIMVNASIDRVWTMLTDLELLDRYDPAVKKATLLSNKKTGIGAKRKVLMVDGKNWFEETVTVFKANEALTYQLTDCSFPIKGLQHSYSFEKIGNQTKVKQVMEYTVKFGLLGKLLDSLMIRKQSDTGIKIFLAGLKSYAETH
ncbi:MAG: SRPBCC family protein [Chitinophagales bacterium]|nr:SRPBCC family protein [Chitinophagales bacterium]